MGWFGHKCKCAYADHLTIFLLCTLMFASPAVAQSGIPASTFGMSPSASAPSNTSGLTTAFSAVDSPTVLFAPGVYNLNCATFSATSSISLIGAGAAKTILRFPSGCSFASDVFRWTSKSNVTIANITIDLNIPVTPTSPINALAFQAYAGSTDQLLVTDSAIINGTSPMFMVGFAAAGGASYTNVRIVNNYVTLAAAARTQNQCIGSTTNDGAGTIPSSEISHNVCVNSGIQSDGAFARIIGNDVSGYQFGTGLFTAYNVSLTNAPTSNNCIIADNVFHDTPPTFDANDTPAGGLENNCYNALVANNLAYNLGGYGFLNYGSNATYIGNTARNNGKAGSGSVSGTLTESGFGLNFNGTHPAYESQNVTLIGNVAFDNGTGTQKYGYHEGLGHTYGAILKGNNFMGALQALNIQRGISNGTTGPDGFISTLGSLAATSTSLAWTTLDTASYKRWNLTCHDVTPTTVAPIVIQTGVGKTPTWNTVSNGYFSNQIDAAKGVTTNVVAGTFAFMGMGTSSWDNSGVLRGGFSVDVGDLGVSIWQKAFRWSGSYRMATSGNYTPFSGTGAWVLDNNAVTAIRVTANGQPFYGVCTLQGFIN